MDQVLTIAVIAVCSAVLLRILVRRLRGGGKCCGSGKGKHRSCNGCDGCPAAGQCTKRSGR